MRADENALSMSLTSCLASCLAMVLILDISTVRGVREVFEDSNALEKNKSLLYINAFAWMIDRHLLTLGMIDVHK